MYYLCDTCSKSYVNLKKLQTHKRNCPPHEKPFACDLCDYRAKLKHHVKEHRANVHLRPKGAVPEHICPRCNRRYYHKRTMNSHLRHDCGRSTANTKILSDLGYFQRE